MNYKQLPLILVITLAYVNQVAGWWATGHLLVAQIAYNDLLAQNNTEAITWVNEILDIVTDYTWEDTEPFIESATWPDNIKNLQLVAFNNWHFVDTPIIEDGIVPPTLDPENIVWALDQCTAALKKIVPAVAKKRAAFARTIVLRQLIHFVGDVHQPLHCSDRYTLKNKKGDLGGNYFIITFNSKIKNLHSLWDSIFNQVSQSISSPMTAANKKTLQGYATSYTTLYPKSSFTLNSSNFSQWADESFAISNNFVYTGINENERPSDEYLSQGYEISRRQVTLAGYRLSNLIRDIVIAHKKDPVATEGINSEEVVINGFLSTN